MITILLNVRPILFLEFCAIWRSIAIRWVVIYPVDSVILPSINATWVRRTLFFSIRIYFIRISRLKFAKF